MKVANDILCRVTKDILRSANVAPATANAVAESLILSDLRGSGTHGVALLPLYLDMIKNNAIDINGVPEIDRRSGTIAIVKGNNSFGQITGKIATDLGIDLANEHGMAAIGIREGGHIGRLSEWSERSCASGLCFIALTNAGGGARNVSGPDSFQRVLSTNPISFGIPTFGELNHDIVADFATSQVSGSTIRERFNAGRPLEQDWTATDEGYPTTDPKLFMDGMSALLPLGGLSCGHKGFALMIAAELLSSISGGLMAGERDDSWFSNGALFIFIDTSVFTSVAIWKKRIRQFHSYITSRGCRSPGSGAAAREANAREQGIEISDHVIYEISRLADTFKVELPREFQTVRPTARSSRTKSW